MCEQHNQIYTRTRHRAPKNSGCCTAPHQSAPVSNSIESFTRCTKHKRFCTSVQILNLIRK